MATGELSDRCCAEAAEPREGQLYVIYWDAKVKGFGFRRTRGLGAFIFQYRQDGRTRRYTIGSFQDPWSTSAARNRARELKKLVDRGEDPQAERVERRQALRVKDLVERWRSEHSPRNRARTRQQNEYLLSQWIIPELGDKLVTEVDHAMINNLHLKIGHTGGKRGPTPYRANRVLALASKLFSLAVLWKLRSDNPVKGIERFHESIRERPLIEDEYERLLAALDAEPDRTAVDIIERLILTGARCNELLTATWGQLVLDGHADPPCGVWSKPATNTKQNKVHRVPLSPEAALSFFDLKARLRVSVLPQDYLFPGLQERGYRRVVYPAWLRIRAAAGLGDLRLHDLRHHFATVLTSEGETLQIIGRLLGHSALTTTARYSHLLDSPLQRAANKVGKAFAAAGARRKTSTSNQVVRGDSLPSDFASLAS
jgi:integrase